MYNFQYMACILQILWTMAEAGTQTDLASEEDSVENGQGM